MKFNMIKIKLKKVKYNMKEKFFETEIKNSERNKIGTKMTFILLVIE